MRSRSGRALSELTIRRVEGVALAVLAGAVASTACTSASTAVTAPTAAKCQVSVGGAPASSFPASGGAGSIAVSTTRDCSWSASAESAWLSLAATSGQGDANVAFTVAANPAPSSRSSALVVGSQRVAVSQAAAPCRFDLSRSGDSIGAPGGRLSVDVATLTGCGWTATTTAAWIGIQSGQSGNANGTVVLSIAANAGAQRSGVVTVAGRTYTVTQEAASTVSPPPTPAPPPQPPPPTPAPAPPPSPPPGSPVELSGSVSSISGRCPNLLFAIGGTLIVTDSSTSFRHGSCGDLKNKKKVTVTGVPDANGTIRATRVDLEGAADN